MPLPRAAREEIVLDATSRVATPPMNSSAPEEQAVGHTLVIEASCALGSVALLRGTSVVQRVDCAMGVSRDDTLFPAILEVLESANVAPRALASIVCGSGPGSFTSLRIAAAIAKGLAHAGSVPLHAVSSLLLAAAAHDDPGEYVVHSDALRAERYAMLVTIDDARCVRADSDVARVSTDALAVLAPSRHRLVVLGASASEHETPVVPDAARLARVYEWAMRPPVKLELWEPVYGRLAEAQVKWEASHQRALPPQG
ncbi:MAG: tRNA (adenosine(37)-N6)-threonylcarbamoyltransferase complex dimerization subunit type 1 TsaB [Gemmatimonas sp.]